MYLQNLEYRFSKRLSFKIFYLYIVNSVVISLKANVFDLDLAQRPNCLMANLPLGQMTHVVIGLWPFGQLFQLALRLISLS